MSLKAIINGIIFGALCWAVIGLVIWFVIWATAGTAEELIVSTDSLDDENYILVYDTAGVEWKVPVQTQACIDTELCGDRVEGSEVRCVRVRICGEPIR
jgi:hypothetical protein